MNIILIGFMGSGKTTLGYELSKKLNMHFLDTDQIIEREEKLKIKEIFKIYGEQYFREKEHELIEKKLKYVKESIISTGGGMPCFFNNMDILKKIGKIFYLKVSLDKIISRIKIKNELRPLLNNGLNIHDLYMKRTQCYEKSDFIIDASGNMFYNISQIEILLKMDLNHEQF